MSGADAAAAEVLDRAASILEPRGAWSKGYFGIEPDGPCACAVGAIGRALGTTHIYRAEEWVDDVAQPFLGMDSADLEDWNDAASRRKFQVIAKLREAAAKARGEL